MAAGNDAVFLVDVDNTLLDNDRLLADLHACLEAVGGPICRQRYLALLDELTVTRGYRDYLGAVQRYRLDYPHEPPLYAVGAFLLDYPFADRLFPDALAVLRRLGEWGRTILLTDGDAVYQPRKLERSGLLAAVGGHALICVHKEQQLDEVQARYPARHHVLIDDKPRILTAVKRQWGERVTTVFARQGSCANDRAAPGTPDADLTIACIGELLRCERNDLVRPRRSLSA